MVSSVESVLLLVRNVSHLVILVSQSLHLLACGVGGVSHEGLYLLDDVALLLQVLALLVTCTSIGGVTSFEELVAGVEEVMPELVADFLRHHADGLPFLLQVDELVACHLPVCAVSQSLSLLHESLLLFDVGGISLLHFLEEF